MKELYHDRNSCLTQHKPKTLKQRHRLLSLYKQKHEFEATLTFLFFPEFIGLKRSLTGTVAGAALRSAFGDACLCKTAELVVRKHDSKITSDKLALQKI